MGYRIFAFTITKRIILTQKETIMSKYIIELDGEIENMLNSEATKRNLTSSKFIVDIVNRYLPLSHIINKEEMARGYEEMAQINLDLAK